MTKGVVKSELKYLNPIGAIGFEVLKVKNVFIIVIVRRWLTSHGITGDWLVGCELML